MTEQEKIQEQPMNWIKINMNTYPNENYKPTHYAYIK